jgi:hypothetical protein
MKQKFFIQPEETTEVKLSEGEFTLDHKNEIINLKSVQGFSKTDYVVYSNKFDSISINKKKILPAIYFRPKKRKGDNIHWIFLEEKERDNVYHTLVFKYIYKVS